MNRNNGKLIDVLIPLISDLYDETYGQIIKRYATVKKCKKIVKTINYPKLCTLSRSFGVTIIQGERIIDAEFNNFFSGSYEHINACYQMDPLKKAIVIAQNYANNSFRIFRYEPTPFDETIFLPNISSFKYLFNYFTVFKSDGLAVDLNDLNGETEVYAISKYGLAYTCWKKDLEIHIILRWYEGYF